ncbi:hypothetical protein BM221_008502 [Beauveria bassiana]|uniref:Uncharacterized protein n=1 Tax=Beauveria bassiana TaxID=176275 RepID=A0A2N6ND21_BEABA|nr:hypothetical protein BM221_008502 [Beauveria bassiana]
MPSPKNLPNLFPPQGIKSGPRNSPPLRSPLATSFPHHRPCDYPSATSEWSQPLDAQLERYKQVAAPRVPNRSGVPVSSFLAEIKSPTQKGELNSLSSLSRLVDEQIPRRLPAMGGVVGEEPIYVDMGPSGGAAVGHDVPSAGSTDDGVGRCYSAAPDHMDTVPVGATGMMQLGAWSAHASPSVNLTHCASDAGCYGFAMQQDGYEGNAMQVTQDYTVYQWGVEALEEERNDLLDLSWKNNGLYAYAFSRDIARSSMLPVKGCRQQGIECER